MQNEHLPARATNTPGRFRKYRWQLVLLILLTITAAAVVIWVATAPSGGNLKSVEYVKSLVANHYLLPRDEQPALATVTDRTKLSSNFFKQADNGDKILIYQKNHIAIIYRPSIDRLVAVGPVSIDTPPSSLTAGGH